MILHNFLKITSQHIECSARTETKVSSPLSEEISLNAYN